MTYRTALFGALIVVTLGIFARPAHAQPESLLDTEQGLLHLHLDLGAARRFRDGKVADELLKTKKPLLVVHLFSLDCPPCLEELPLLRQTFRSDLPDIDFALLSETLDVPRLGEFLRQRGAQVPAVPLYLSTDRRLRGTAQLGIETIPITLLLDQNFVVRQAFVGSLKGRMHELSDALGSLLAALKRQPQPIVAALTGSAPMDPTKLLHHAVATQSHVGGARREARPPSRVNLLYLFGRGCKECSEELDGRLRRMTQGWSRTKEVSFAVLNCEDDPDAVTASPRSARLAASYFRSCGEGPLQQVWTRAQRPVTLLVDSHHVVRDAFIGPVGSSVGVAVRRLLSDPQ